MYVVDKCMKCFILSPSHSIVFHDYMILGSLRNWIENTQIRSVRGCVFLLLLSARGKPICNRLGINMIFSGFNCFRVFATHNNLMRSVTLQNFLNSSLDLLSSAVYKLFRWGFDFLFIELLRVTRKLFIVYNSIYDQNYIFIIGVARLSKKGVL